MSSEKMPARVEGHGLVAEGAKHHPDGTMVTYGYAVWPDRTGAGRARCSCGLLSPDLPSARARRQWHREHKAEVWLVRQQEATGAVRPA